MRRDLRVVSCLLVHHTTSIVRSCHRITNYRIKTSHVAPGLSWVLLHASNVAGKYFWTLPSRKTDVLFQVIQMIWFWMICRIAWRVVMGGEASDDRSDDEGCVYHCVQHLIIDIMEFLVVMRPSRSSRPPRYYPAVWRNL
jgi:hypothetical protein